MLGKKKKRPFFLVNIYPKNKRSPRKQNNQSHPFPTSNPRRLSRAVAAAPRPLASSRFWSGPQITLGACESRRPSPHRQPTAKPSTPSPSSISFWPKMVFIYLFCHSLSVMMLPVSGIGDCVE